MEKYIPDIYQKSVYALKYDKLLKRGIKCILFDIDNTLVSSKSVDINDKVKELFNTMKHIGIKPIIFSSSNKRRVSLFTDALDIEGYSNAYKKSLENMNELLSKYKESEIAIVGDQMIPEIVFGNKVGITTILVNPISTKDSISSHARRFRERRIMRKLRDNNLFVKGRYYE